MANYSLVNDGCLVNNCCLVNDCRLVVRSCLVADCGVKADGCPVADCPEVADRCMETGYNLVTIYSPLLRCCLVALISYFFRSEYSYIWRTGKHLYIRLYWLTYHRPSQFSKIRFSSITLSILTHALSTKNIFFLFGQLQAPIYSIKLVVLPKDPISLSGVLSQPCNSCGIVPMYTHYRFNLLLLQTGYVTRCLLLILLTLIRLLYLSRTAYCCRMYMLVMPCDYPNWRRCGG